MLFPVMFVAPLGAGSISLRITGGAGYISGGELNRSIRGWKDYYGDLNKSPYAYSYSVKEIHFFPEGGLLLSHEISPRWTLGVEAGFGSGSSSGEIAGSYNLNQTDSPSPGETRTIASSEKSLQQPEYSLGSTPVMLVFSYMLHRGKRTRFFIEGGAGLFLGRLSYSESYEVDIAYTEDLSSPGSQTKFVNDYSSWGRYTEKTRSLGFGARCGFGAEWRLSDSMSFVVLGSVRRMEAAKWKGDKSDSFEWRHTWGLYGGNSDRGEDKTADSGSLWSADMNSADTGKSYRRVVFAAEKPSGSAYSNPRAARIAFSGVSLQVGLKFTI
jgi:hypothetical protein